LPEDAELMKLTLEKLPNLFSIKGHILQVKSAQTITIKTILGWVIHGQG
jgi:hypothetical protein